MYGSGNYHLAPGYVHYRVPLPIWSAESDEAKAKMFDEFLQDKKRARKSITVKAHNVSFEIPNEQKLAKNGQKRKRTKTGQSLCKQCFLILLKNRLWLHIS